MYNNYGQALSDRSFDTTEVMGDLMDMLEATSLKFEDVVPFDEMDESPKGVGDADFMDLL